MGIIFQVYSTRHLSRRLLVHIHIFSVFYLCRHYDYSLGPGSFRAASPITEIETHKDKIKDYLIKEKIFGSYGPMAH